MLPFSNTDFFIFFGAAVFLLFICKLLLSKFIPYKLVLLFITLYYLTFLFPNPLQAFGFVIYCYSIYWLFDYVLKIKQRLLGVILLLLPMLFVKLKFQTDVLSFAGLSYTTFRVIQIYLDNNSDKKPANLITYILFMLFPATLLIGPIDRFNRFQSDLDSGYTNLSKIRFFQGYETILLGFLQKFIVAELLNRYWLKGINYESKELGDMAQYMYAYTFYLYFDFAGYSNLAVGLGKMCGIDVPFNFNIPFLAINPQDFWKRWHASLGDWLRDYIFRPYYKWISGKKSLKNYSLFKQNSGLFLTFTTMGLWNGFKANFIISGCVFGLYSVVHNTYLVQCRKKGRDVIFMNLNSSTVKYLSIFFMFNFACFAMYIFSGKFPFIK